MSRLSRRSVVAMGAVVVGIGGPLGYAGVMGHEAASAEAAERLRAPRLEAEQAAGRVADRLGERLAALVEQESERPFFHYQNFIVDPRGAYEGAAVVPSPLAERGAPVGDRLVAAYFQIDPQGRVTMPRVVEGVADAPPPAAEDVALLAALREADIPRPPPAPLDEPIGVAIEEPIEVAHVADAMRADAVALANAEPELELVEPSVGKSGGGKSGGGKTGVKGGSGKRVVQQVRLNEEQYQQNVEANELYNAIQNRRVGKPSIDGGQAQEPLGQVPMQQADPSSPRADPSRSRADRDVVVRVGPLAWETMNVAGEPTLVALRAIETPDGARTQGFMVDAEALAALVTDVAPESRLSPPTEGDAELERGGVKVKLPGLDWRVTVPFEGALATAESEASAVMAEFRLRFAGMSALGLLAMVAVMWALWLGERHLERRQRFAAAAAHELRTPLAGLKMYAEMLAHGLGKPDKQKVYAERLASEAGRLGRVVANVLDFTRMERGNLSVKPVPGDLVATVREQVARLEPSVRAAGATIELALPDAPVVATFDADAVHQIVQNLVDNAEKYGRQATDRRIHVSVGEGADGAEVVIADHGPGIAPRFESHLFVPFARGDADGPAGLGLGLALTRTLARAQRGDVRHARPPDGGAEFRLVLPRA
ncbi:MAG: HAMP domain-containing histidine kinase [Deltaproteobacteria bacterium]|nr:HAMP domain-containing histidine kinase [Deltaproteobacteria bacterium]